MRQMDNNMIVYTAGAFAAGIWAAGLYTWPLSFLYIAAATGLILAGLVVYRQPAKAGPFVLMVFFLAGAIRFIHAEAISPIDISHREGQTIAVMATVDEIPDTIPLEDGKAKIKYVLEVQHTLDRQGIVQPAAGRLLATVSQDERAPVARYGDQVSFNGKISLFHGYHNPGAYDYAAALKRKGISARAQVIGGRVTIANPDIGGTWQENLAFWRQAIKKAMDASMQPEQSAILFGMLFGGYTEIPQAVVKDFQTTGLVHILSVSGTHVALVAGVILGAGRAVGFRYGPTAAAAGIAIMVYSVLSGLTPPVVRSAVMGLIALAAIAFDREKDAPSALALSALGMLVFTPGLIYDLSFQLSFAATAGLVFLYPQTVKQLHRLPLWLAAGLAVTLVAQLSVLPFLAWYFNSLSLSAFIANIVVVPFIEALVVVGLVGAILVSFWPAASWVFAFCGMVVGVVEYITSMLAALPGSSVYVPPVGIAAGFIYYTMLAWLYGYKPSVIPSAQHLFYRAPKLISGCVALLLLVITLYSQLPQPVAVHFIDVGQGDAVLMTTPHKRAVLVDTGGITSEKNGFDVGDRVVVPYLKHYGIVSLDYLILTHGHQDHAGGAAAIIASLPVKTVLVASEPHTKAVRNMIQLKGKTILIPADERQTILLDGVAIDIVHAVGQEQPIKSGNEASTVARVSFGRHSFLLTGDLTAAEEKVMVGKGLEPVTVLKVAHHGARSSTSPEFLQAVKPQYAVISLGSGNRYGHPHAETLKRLESRGIDIFRTDHQGAIVFTTDGAKLSVNTFM
jgi:competence protein ComEC